MLVISPAAATAMGKTLEGVSIPDGAGLRFIAGDVSDRGIAIDITFVTSSGPDDQVVDIGGPADVFLEPAAAELLDDQVLDARSDGNGGVIFSLRPQGAGDEAPSRA